MSVTVSIAVLLCVAFVVPASTLSCIAGFECIKTPCNITSNGIKKIDCPTILGMDTCMKLDFGTYNGKTCAPKSACDLNGLLSYGNSIPNGNFKNLINSPENKALLSTNKNLQGRTVLNCCQNADYCNAGMYNALSPMAVLGLALAFLFV